MANLLDQASIVLTPTAYDDGKVLCAKPSEPPYGDFDFSRNSAATRVNAQGLVENVQILSSNLVQNGDFSEQGAEEVSNGSFSQEGAEQADDSVISNSGGAVMTKVSALNYNATSDGTGVSIVRPRLLFNNITIGKSYRIRINPTNQSGTINFKLYDGSQYIITGNDLTTDVDLYFKAEGTSVFIAFDGTEVFNVDFEISLKEVGQDWTLGTGWSIGEDKAIYDNSASSVLNQSFTWEVGKTYKITFDIGDFTTSQRFDIYSGVSFIKTAAVESDTSYTIYFNGDGGSTFRFRGLTTESFSITNISVKEVGQNWDLGTGWSIGDGVAVAISGTSSKLTQSISGLSGKKCSVTFTLSNYGGNGNIKLDFGSEVGQNRSANGTYTEVGTYDIDRLEFFKNAGFEGSITNISVIEITDDTNLPRINYEGFSYQDALGSELITNGSFEDGLTDWTAYAGTISIETNIVHSGTQSAKVDGVGIQQSRSYTDGEQVYYNFWVYSTTGTSVFIQTINENVTIPLNQWVQVSGIGTINGNNSSFRIRIANGLWYIDNVSVKEYLGQEVVPDSGCGSWLWEPQSTNLITYSEDFSNASWTRNSAVIEAASITLPNGLTNGQKLFANTTSGVNHWLEKTPYPTATTGQDYTLSLFVKSAGSDFIQIAASTGFSVRYQNFNISTGTKASGDISDSSITDFGNGWYRISVTETTIATSARYLVVPILSDGGRNPQFAGNADEDGVYIWGAQIEQQSYATSYIPTEGSSVTRNQDLCTNGGSLASINSTEGVLYFEGAALANSVVIQRLSLSDGTNSNRVYLQNSTANNQIFVSVVSGGVSSVNVSTTSYDITQFNKIAIKFKANDFALWINGIEVATDTNAVMPIGLNELAYDDGNGGLQYFGKTKCLAVWKEALSDQELADLTYPTPTDPTFALDFDTIATDFTFARGSEATYVDAQGLIQSTNELGPELVTNGDFSGNTDWSFIGDTIIQNGVAEFPTSTNSFLIQSNVVALSVKTYKLQYEVITTNGNNFRLAGGNSAFGLFTLDSATIGVKTIYIVSNGTQANLQFNNDNFIGSIDNVSVKEYITATNTPRLDYSTGAEAFLLEPQTTQLLPYSEDFSQSSWSKGSDISIESGYLAPDGNTTAYKVTKTGGGAPYLARNQSLVTTTTRSIYARSVSGTGTATLLSHSSNTNNVFTLTEQWQRFELSDTASSTGLSTFYAADFRGSGTLTEYLIWGANATNDQNYATSYIPTLGTTVTRNQETCINATPEINSEEGVLYAEISALADDQSYRYITLSDGTTSNYVVIRYYNIANKISAFIENTSGVQGSTSHSFSPSETITNFHKVAFKWKANDFALWIDGTEVNTQSSGTTFSANVLNKLQFNEGDGSGNEFFGNTKDVQVYTKALSDAELIKLTT